MAQDDVTNNILETILHRLDALDEWQRVLITDVRDLKKDAGSLKEELDRKIEAVHAYQKEAHTEIMDRLFESNEANGQEQQRLEKCQFTSR